ncbi:hypothetical protein QVD17_02815 [Tagetes erecta]|uniref:Prefoldin subunit 2 n=1 Tax=Tagetes erecta TaxID=13708 RepID=A0AAD8L7A4_TARER|nr:hypothetical protein QVD17_02815 [Tagetes erecta]
MISSFFYLKKTYLKVLLSGIVYRRSIAVGGVYSSPRSAPHTYLHLLLASIKPLKLHIMAGVSGSEHKEPINEQEVAAKYSSIRTEMNQIYSKITELEMEASEHSLVINAIQPLDPARRCYRMIGGVLVERTIKEVLPAVQQNKEGIEVVIARLNEALERKKKELTDFESKYKIRIRKNDGESADDNSKKEGSAQGVLVGPANA